VILEEYLRTSAAASASAAAPAPRTPAPVKVTLIGPDRIAQRFAREQSRDVYPDMDAFLADVVAIERRTTR
jgi:hypothetical protein